MSLQYTVAPSIEVYPKAFIADWVSRHIQGFVYRLNALLTQLYLFRCIIIIVSRLVNKFCMDYIFCLESGRGIQHKAELAVEVECQHYKYECEQILHKKECHTRIHWARKRISQCAQWKYRHSAPNTLRNVWKRPRFDMTTIYRFTKFITPAKNIIIHIPANTYSCNLFPLLPIPWAVL